MNLVNDPSRTEIERTAFRRSGAGATRLTNRRAWFETRERLAWAIDACAWDRYVDLAWSLACPGTRVPPPPRHLAWSAFEMRFLKEGKWLDLVARSTDAACVLRLDEALQHPLVGLEDMSQADRNAYPDWAAQRAAFPFKFAQAVWEHVGIDVRPPSSRATGEVDDRTAMLRIVAGQAQWIDVIRYGVTGITTKRIARMAREASVALLNSWGEDRRMATRMRLTESQTDLAILSPSYWVRSSAQRAREASERGEEVRW